MGVARATRPYLLVAALPTMLTFLAAVNTGASAVLPIGIGEGKASFEILAGAALITGEQTGR